MEDATKYLKDLGSRNNGDVYLGVVGPVRVGKSTFVRKFMEVCVLEHIENEDEKKRAIDELPTTGDGKTITTIEPKFIPSNAVSLNLDEMKVNVRLVDCVGYIIESSTGYLEDGKMRMVQTPWFNDAIPFDDAAKIGTQKVIKDHSTLGIVILSDGTINDFSVLDYMDAEKRVLNEMATLEKPYVIVLNSSMPNGEKAKARKDELMQNYGVPVIPIDVKNMTKEEASLVLKEALYQFPVTGIELMLPTWVSSLDEEHYIKFSLKQSISNAMNEVKIVKDVDHILDVIKENEYVKECSMKNGDTGSGVCLVQLDVNEGLYEKVLNELVGCEITDKGELIKILTEYVKAKKDYDLIGDALQMASSTGYGFASTSLKDFKVSKPEVTKSGSRYGVKVKASASTYHIIKVDVETTFEPILGSKQQAEYFEEYLLNSYNENPLKVLDCELFGRKYEEIISQGIEMKLHSLPEPVKIKMQQLLKTISNKGKTNLIAFVF